MSTHLESGWRVPEAARIVALLSELMAPVEPPAAPTVEVDFDLAATPPLATAVPAAFVAPVASAAAAGPHADRTNGSAARGPWGARPVGSFFQSMNWNNAAAALAPAWGASPAAAPLAFDDSPATNGAAHTNGHAAAARSGEPVGKLAVGKWFAAANWTNAARAAPAVVATPSVVPEKRTTNRLNVSEVLSAFEWN